MKAGAASPETIAARLRSLGVTSASDVRVPEIAKELGVGVDAIKGAIFEASGGHKDGADLAPHTSKGTPKGHGAMSLLSMTKAMTSSKQWDPVGRLPANLQARLSPGDRRAIESAIGQLQKQVREAKLDYVPVFGYLSLRTNNFAELGKKSQDDVVAGRDVVDAKLPGYDVDVLVSTMFRGTPEHPGAVAGLGEKKGASTPGSVLKVPLDRAEELLAVLLAREMFAEGDLVDNKDAQGNAVSNAMYAPKVVAVDIDGASVPALVFTTNDLGDKSIGPKLEDSKGEGLSVERMAYLFAAQGGFVNAEGKAFGGPAIDYWEKSYLKAREAAGQPVNPKIAAAIELSKLLPQEPVMERILERTDKDARLMLEAFRLLFRGIATPLATKHHQKSDLDGLVRKPQGDRGDIGKNLLDKAKQLERDGKISVS